MSAEFSICIYWIVLLKNITKLWLEYAVSHKMYKDEGTSMEHYIENNRVKFEF